MICYTAIFSPYDDLKEPKIITPGWRYICYTDQDLKSDIWQVIKVETPMRAQLAARYYKIMQHSTFVDDSIWIDGSFLINCNLTEFWEKNAVGPMTFCCHPFRKGWIDEIEACLEQSRAPSELLLDQLSFYKTSGIPDSPIAATGLIMRFYDQITDDFCKKWHEEVKRWSPRDQIAWAKIAHQNPKGVNMITWDYTTAMDFIHIPHLHNPKREARLQFLKQNGITL